MDGDNVENGIDVGSKVGTFGHAGHNVSPQYWQSEHASPWFIPFRFGSKKSGQMANTWTCSVGAKVLSCEVMMTAPDERLANANVAKV